MSTFYEDISPFTVFDEITHARHYRPVPGHWWVVISDVRGSTQAIQAGRYKDVNTLGAATITVSQNVLGRRLPFIFGGDGATLLVPPEGMDRLQPALRGLQRLAREQFQLDLRVALVPVQTLLDAGHQLDVARFVQEGVQSFAAFRGDGVQAVEWWMKLPQSPYHLPPGPESEAPLQGLSCRWQLIPSARGHILNILVQARSDRREDDLALALQGLREALGDEALEQANPAGTSRAEHRTLRDCLAYELRYHRSAWSPALWFRLAETVLATLVFRYGFPSVVFDKRRYTRSFRGHSDFRKFDGTLRMVLDCTAAQVEDVRARLESLRNEGRVHYGLHASSEALMTCMVMGMSDGQHVHLVDGSNGGYAVAALQLKAQVAGPPQPGGSAGSALGA
ncbi:MAG: DUF3095 family protein [Deltaproteobacteria bacterium]|nr:DUF3095 family protein [Deltaproteobacteria bacterium]